jgi:hypothetical protein
MVATLTAQHGDPFRVDDYHRSDTDYLSTKYAPIPYNLQVELKEKKAAYRKAADELVQAENKVGDMFGALGSDYVVNTGCIQRTVTVRPYGELAEIRTQVRNVCVGIGKVE